MQLDRLYTFILMLTLTFALASAQNSPQPLTNLDITSTSSCSTIPTSSCANQCLACYLQPGCIPCAVSATEFQCIPEFTYLQNGSVLYGNNTCTNLNTAYGSRVAQPRDCLTQGMGNWVYKLTTRRDLSFFSFNDQVNYNNSFANYTTNLLNQLSPLINLYNTGSYGSLLTQTQNQTSLLGQQNANLTSSSSWCAADNNATGNFLYYALPQWQTMQQDRQYAENASLTNATTTAQYVQQYFSVAAPYYCNATQRLLERAYFLQNFSSALENAQLTYLLSTYKDFAQIKVDNSTCQNNTLCNWNNTYAQQLMSALQNKQALAWNGLFNVEDMKAYLSVFIPKVLALQQRKCVEESNIGGQLNGVVGYLQNQQFKTYTNLATLNQSTSNPTSFNDTLDELTEFMVEVEDVNATIVNRNDPSANNLTWFFTVQRDLDSLTQNVNNVSSSFCVSLRAFLVAFYGLNGSEIQCDASKAQQVSFYSNGANYPTVNTPVIISNTSTVTELLNSPVLPTMSYGANPSFMVFNITVFTFPSTATNNIIPMTNYSVPAPGVIVNPVNGTVPNPSSAQAPTNQTTPPIRPITFGNPPGFSPVYGYNGSNSLVVSIIGLILLVCCCF